MRNIRIVIISIMIMLLSGCSLLSKDKATLKPPLIKPVEQSFDIAKVKRGTLTRELKNNAQFISIKKQDLYFKSVGGRLKSILVKSGESVKKGDVLAELESEDYESRVFVQKRMLEKATINFQQIVKNNSEDAVQLELAKIDVELARKELEHLNDLLIKTKLIATIDGIVTYVSVLREGDYITAYNTVVSLSDPKQLQLSTEFTNPNETKEVKVGMKVEIAVNSDIFQGHILQAPSSVPAKADPNKQEMNKSTVIIGVDGLPEDIEIGASANIVITLQKKLDILIIPENAVSNYLGRKYVHILDGEIRKEMDVETGISANNEVEIIKGVQEGQQVIIN